jgi:DNA-binding XRE family transcriptional regulator
MPTSFADFLSEIDAEARAEGPDAAAHLQQLHLRFSIARQLAAHRCERRLTQEQLAQLSGIAQSAISRIECGRADAPIATLAALTSALEVDVQLVKR